jgi:hypothetical protein
MTGKPFSTIGNYAWTPLNVRQIPPRRTIINVAGNVRCPAAGTDVLFLRGPYGTVQPCLTEPAACPHFGLQWIGQAGERLRAPDMLSRVPGLEADDRDGFVMVDDRRRE